MRRVSLWRVFWGVWCVAFALGANGGLAQSLSSATGILRRENGAVEKAELRGIRENGVMEFAGASKFELATNEVWRFGGDNASLRGAYVLLRDGSRMSAPQPMMEGDEIVFPADELHPGLWDGERLKRTELQAILWKPLHGAAARMMCYLLRTPIKGDDILRLDNRDKVQGDFRGIKSDTAAQSEEVLITVRGAESRLSTSRCVSLHLADREGPVKVDLGDYWTLAFADGSRVHAKDLVAGAEGASWKSVSGDVRKVRGELFWKNLTCIVPPAGNSIYLSALKHQSYRHLPTFGTAVEWRRNRTVDGHPLTHGGAEFEIGVGMHSNSQLTFAVPPGAKRFQAEICIDDEAGDQGSAIFRVLAQVKGEKGTEFKDLYRSEVLRGGEESKLVNVDLKGASSLVLLVEAADRGDTGDLADWLAARFVLEPNMK